MPNAKKTMEQLAMVEGLKEEEVEVARQGIEGGLINWEEENTRERKGEGRGLNLQGPCFS